MGLWWLHVDLVASIVTMLVPFSLSTNLIHSRSPASIRNALVKKTAEAVDDDYLPDTFNMCHEGTLDAIPETIGGAVSMVSLEILSKRAAFFLRTKCRYQQPANEASIAGGQKARRADRDIQSAT